MASKYINLEDAAKQLSISTMELNRLREQGQIRAFSDRGTWKFKAEDIETLGRTLKPDSGFDMPSLDDDDDMIRLDDDMDLGGGSQIVLEEEMGDQPTVISKKSPGMPPSSDSDVRLVVDPSLESEMLSAPSLSRKKQEPPRTTSDSDSDIRLADDLSPPATPLRTESEDDSKVSLSDAELSLASDSDSDVRLSPIDLDSGDGSDITLQAESGISRDKPKGSGSDSDSDVTLMGDLGDNPPSGIDLSGSDIIGDSGAGSDITLMPLDEEESGAHLLEEGDEEREDSVLGDVVSGPESGLSFSSGDSGISLDLAVDSGLSLDDGDDDSITLGADSGISLIPDSGLGLTLDDTYSQKDDDADIPFLQDAEEEDADTSFDMPLMQDSGDEIEQDDPTGVVMFDDDESADTMEFDSSELSGDSEEFVDFEDDEDSYDELSDSELDVSDDMLDSDVLEADDEDFEDDFESGESVSALPAAAGFRGGAAPAMAAEWDMLSFSLVLVSTICMGVCTLLMFDLVRSMWAHQSPIGINGMILDALQGIIKS